MGRNKTAANNGIRDLFEYKEDEKKSECKMCKTKFAGEHLTNLKRHIIAKHAQFFNNMTENFEGSEPPKKKVKISYSIEPDSFKNSILKIVTKDGRPFAQLDSEGFREIVDPIFKALNMNPINSHNVIQLINDRVLEIKNNIKNVVVKKLVSIKIDAATRLNRSILGINLQYIEVKNSKLEIVIKTLGMKPLPHPHTGENIKRTVLETLAEYDIPLEQIYSVTSDNGRNMLKAVEIMSHNFIELFDFEEEAVEADFANCIHSMRCAAHSLQLCVTDVHKDTTIKNNIGVIRKVCKLLRGSKYRTLLNTCNRGVPPIDVATRWNSTYLMAKKVLELRDFVDGEETLSIIVDWDWLHDYVAALEPFWVATKKLQEEQLPLCDLFKIWMELKLNFRDCVQNAIKQNLHNALLNRESLLLSNVPLLSAVYLDPRLNLLLSEPQKNLAKANLKATAKQIFSLKQSKPISAPENSEQITQHESSDQEPISGHNSSKLGTFLDEVAQDVVSVIPHDEVMDLTAIFTEIDNFESLHRRLSINEDILSYYQQVRFRSPELFELALVVFGVPATQVSVERSFSSLNFILDERRYNLSDEALEKILVVKLNI